MNDPTMDRIMAAIALYQRGESDAARAAMAALWAEVGGDGNPLHRCALAHYMADFEADPADALAWNQRALDAAEELSEAGVKEVLGGVELRSFFPSLHLNLAEDFRLLGDNESAARHARLASKALEGLPDEGLVAMIRGGVERLQARLAEGSD